MDRFAGGETDSCPVQLHGLRREAFQVHLDSPLVGVVESAVTKLRQVEIGLEVTIDAGEQIEIESRRHFRGVIVGGMQDLFVFLEIDPDKQRSALADDRGGRPQ